MKSSQFFYPNPLGFLAHFLFPRVCLHCEEMSPTLFCEGCAAYFELIDPAMRCPFCFREKEESRLCAECIRKKRGRIKVASALDYASPVCTVVKKMKYGGIPYLAKTAAAFMLLQFERLGWETPDYIVPVPRRLWLKGTNHAELLAKRLAWYMKREVRVFVGRRIGDLAQARLNRELRESVLESGFYLKKRAEVEGKTLLLIDDVMTTGTTLRLTAEALEEGFPKKIYALTFARALDSTNT